MATMRSRGISLCVLSCSIIGLAHLYFRVNHKKGLPLPSSKRAFSKETCFNRREKCGEAIGVKNILVTGGSGLVGSAIVRQLMAMSTHERREQKIEYNVVSLDLNSPAKDSERFVEGVKYISGNLSKLEVDSMAAILKEHSIHGVIHTAGIVLMKHDPVTLNNINYLATKMLLEASYYLTNSVSCFILTSSTSVVHPGTRDILNLSPKTKLEDPHLHPYKYSSAYACSKAKAELETLSLSDSVNGFHTAALRLPGIYGFQDPWLFGPLLDNKLFALPGNPSKIVEMVYVENAAHGHICALETLLSCPRNSSASGRAYHITNNEPKITMGELLTTAVKSCPNQPVSMPYQLPLLLSKVICFFVEFFYAFSQGNVFMPSHPIWNFTSAALGYMTHHNSFSTEGNDLIGYKPLFSVRDSVLDVMRLHKLK